MPFEEAAFSLTPDLAMTFEPSPRVRYAQIALSAVAFWTGALAVVGLAGLFIAPRVPRPLVIAGVAALAAHGSLLLTGRTRRRILALHARIVAGDRDRGGVRSVGRAWCNLARTKRARNGLPAITALRIARNGDAVCRNHTIEAALVLSEASSDCQPPSPIHQPRRADAILDGAEFHHPWISVPGLEVIPLAPACNRSLECPRLSMRIGDVSMMICSPSPSTFWSRAI